ncbi:hypothetical protein L3Y19_gp077 [Gordonia phage Neville]|uniref:Uncharacterized protein n=1 Tax=Gordonia phage Neville TaxID=2301693 RepID=A0A385DYB8_9CAUD|nr:hypothetical protein L3Y19_gp077 [Gordonia phage Neville]AXQ64446.1 hypothetical protein SEA_NEVILLE_77 [Gordonia phage Neville]
MLWRSRAIHRQAVTDWMTQRPTVDEVELPEDVTEKLQRLAAQNSRRPDAVQLIQQIPYVVAWFRESMVSGSHPGGEEDIKSSAGPSSRPPFRVAFMSAADREVAALVHWCHECGVSARGPVYMVAGSIRGVSPRDPSSPIRQMAEELSDAVSRWGEPEGIYTDPEFGLWSIRSAHYGIWPELGSLFAGEPDVPDPDDDVEPEGLF